METKQIEKDLKKKFDDIMQYINCSINSEDELWKLFSESIIEAKKETLERVKTVILNRTGIPKSARHPTRDYVVILGEELCRIIDVTVGGKEIEEPKKEKMKILI